MNCPTCGAPMIRKNRARLVITGGGILAAAVLVVVAIHIFLGLLTALALAVMGFYFLTWALKAGGWWCRGCKTYPRAFT